MRIDAIQIPEDPKNESMIISFLDDKHTRYRLIAPRMYAWSINIGDIVKVRSIERIEGNNILLPHSKYHGVLVIPTYFKDYKDFMENLIANDALAKSKANSPVKDPHPYHHVGFDIEFFKKKGEMLNNGQMLCSRVAEDWYQTKSFLTLEQIYQELENPTEDNSPYLSRATLIDIHPTKLEDAMRNQCKNCKLLRKIHSKEGEICCQIKMERILLLRMLWIDESIENTKKCFITYSFPEDGDKTRSPFPDFDISTIKVGEIENYQNKWDALIEYHLEGNKVYDLLVTPFADDKILEREKQRPLRIFDTVFLPYE